MFRGSFVALITPFTTQNKIDQKALESLVEWQIAEGTDGIVCCGSTGEGSVLNRAERKRVASICVKVAAGRIPILVGTGTCDTRQSIQYTEDALNIGASGCLVITPYYNKPTQQGCLAHFAEVAKVGLPVIVYHNPPRTCIRLTLETLQALSQIPGIVALKDSNRDLDLIRQSPLPVFSGDDDITYEILQAGGVGAISVIGNVIPRGWKQMISSSKGKQLAERYLPLCKAHFIETNPQCVKYVVSQMGRCQPILRLPLLLPTQETRKALIQTLVQLALYGRNRNLADRVLP